MRKFIIVLILGMTAAGVGYKLGYFDNSIKRYILKEKLSKSNISSTPANAAIMINDAIIHKPSKNNPAALLTLTLKNNTNKTHELVKIESELGGSISFYEVFFKDNKRSMQQVFGLPIEGYSIVTLTPNNRYAEFSDIENPLKTGETISIKLIFSDNTEKNLQAIIQ